MTMRVVPDEPTNEMIHAGMAAYHEFGTPMTRYANIYKAMLAAHSPAADDWVVELTMDDMRKLMAQVTSDVVDCDLLGNPITDYDVLYMGAYGKCILRLLNAARSALPSTCAEVLEEAAKNDRLSEIIKAFVQKQEVRCAESIYQMDNVIENAYELLEELITIVGYYKDDDAAIRSRAGE